MLFLLVWLTRRYWRFSKQTRDVIDEHSSKIAQAAGEQQVRWKPRRTVRRLLEGKGRRGEVGACVPGHGASPVADCNGRSYGHTSPLKGRAQGVRGGAPMPDR